MAQNTIEINNKGTWVSVPALNVNGLSIIVRGTWLRVASVHDEGWMETEIQDPQACVNELKKDGPGRLGADLFTFTQKPSETVPKYNFPFEWDSIAVIRCGNFKEWWEKLPQEARKNVRRSQKRGVMVKVQSFDDNLLEGIRDVNNDSPVRQGEQNYYYCRTVDQLRKDYSAFVDRSDFICAYHGEEMIGFAKIVYRGDVASILNFTPKPSHADKRPANALISRAVELCEARGISYLTYGMYNYGNKRDSSLREFKTRNGFEEIKTPRFYVSLTTWGDVCLRLKLHRGILGILPPAAIAAWLNARARWQDSRQQWISRCSSMSERPNRNRQMERSNPPAGSNS